MKDPVRLAFTSIGILFLSLFVPQTLTLAQQCLPPPSRMVAWYPGDGNANDIAGGNHGTLQGGATFAAGMVKEAFSFNGDGANVVAPDAPALNPTAAISIDAWVFAREIGNFMDLVGKDGESQNRQYLLNITNEGRFRAHIGTPEGFFFVDSNTVIQTNTWYHVVMTYNGQELNLYVNGALDATMQLTGQIIVTKEALRIGGGAPDGQQQFYFNGLIDEVEIFDRALSDEEIIGIFSAGSAGKCKPPAGGQLIISEFRFRGPDNTQRFSPAASPLPSSSSGQSAKTRPTRGQSATPVAIRVTGSAADNNEFIEFHNTSDVDLVVMAEDGSGGYALVAADGATRFVIPDGTVVPARGHYLAVNSFGYSLSDYGCAGCAAGDISYSDDIPDGSGIALFKTANPQNFTVANRLDAVGYSQVEPLYREGAGFPATGRELNSNLEYSFLRYQGTAAGGRTKDTDDNLADFISVDTGGNSTSIGQRLGAPGPQNLASPIQNNALFPPSLIDRLAAQGEAPNRQRDETDVRGTHGTISFRRTFTNNSDQSVNFLVFRIVDITTFPAPDASTADLRAIDSQSVTVTINDEQRCGGAPPCDVTAQAVTLEEPPAQPAGGGWNSSLLLLPGGPINPGETVSVNFTLAVEQRGTFRFYVNVEAPTNMPLPVSPAAPRKKAGPATPKSYGAYAPSTSRPATPTAPASPAGPASPAPARPAAPAPSRPAAPAPSDYDEPRSVPSRRASKFEHWDF